MPSLRPLPTLAFCFLLAACSFGGSAFTNARTYWVTETNLNIHLPVGKVSWDLKVMERGNKEADTPATGATVTAELRDSKATIPLSGTVAEDGWVRFERDFPELETRLHITGIEGDLEWNKDDRAYAERKAALSYLNNVGSKQ